MTTESNTTVATASPVPVNTDKRLTVENYAAFLKRCGLAATKQSNSYGGEFIPVVIDGKKADNVTVKGIQYHFKGFTRFGASEQEDKKDEKKKETAAVPGEVKAPNIGFSFAKNANPHLIPVVEGPGGIDDWACTEYYKGIASYEPDSKDELKTTVDKGYKSCFRNPKNEAKAKIHGPSIRFKIYLPSTEEKVVDGVKTKVTKDDGTKFFIMKDNEKVPCSYADIYKQPGKVEAVGYIRSMYFDKKRVLQTDCILYILTPCENPLDGLTDIIGTKGLEDAKAFSKGTYVAPTQTLAAATPAVNDAPQTPVEDDELAAITAYTKKKDKVLPL